VIISTTDGVHWFVLDSGTTVALRAIHFATVTTGWAVGDGGTVLKTVDGGTTWMPQSASVTVALRSVYAIDTTRAWAVGDGGTLLRTIDGGQTWTASTVGSGGLYAVRFADAARGCLVGQNGHIATTADGGATWTARDGGTDAHLRGAHFESASTGWTVGDTGTILKTTDGGLTWTRQSASVMARLRSIAFVGPLIGWAVGDGGVALRTVDGGTTWSRADVGARALHGVALVSNTLGWIVGDDSLAARISSQPLTVAQQRLPGASLSLGPGRLYVDGILCELEKRASFYAQPDRRVTDRLTTGTHLFYIDAWQRYVSHLEDPTIREIALGGPDTAARSQTVWQVRALPVDAASPSPTCLSDFPDFRALAEPSAARLRARAEPAQIATSVCEIGASAGFRRLENQLYRVEVHAGAPAPAFKWSRENGAVAYAIVSIAEDPVKSETVVTLASRGLDDNLDLGVGDWVEIGDDSVALEQGARPLFEYLREGNDPREIVLQGIVPATIGRDSQRHPILRRWEQKPASGSQGTLLIEEDKWIDLEEGVQVWFAPGGTYRPGDYWLVPARTITGDVEWERDETGEPRARRPHGIEHHYCRLALVDADHAGTLAVLSDCRELFPPLTAMTQLLYVSGDGQDGIPGSQLPQLLQVRVVRGSHPVVGARVQFSVDLGNGHLVSPSNVSTGPDGVAACGWVLDADPAPAHSYQRVRARLLDAADHGVEGQEVVFCATGTVSLQYVGGDGQEGTAGQRLTYPIQVRVSNGQRPVSGARIGFIVTGDGQVVGSNPVFTDNEGLATVFWQLGDELPQSVEARLLDLGNTVIQRVVFNAAFIPQPTTAAVGCCLTVGPGGDVPELSSEVLMSLLDRQKGLVCLCLLAGNHTVAGLEVTGNGTAHISIRGCGPASRIHLTKPAAISRFASFGLDHLRVDADENCGFRFEDSAEVSVTSVTVVASSSPAVPVFLFGGVSAVTVTDSQIRTKIGTAVVFGDGLPVARLIDSEIDGVLSFYGNPGSSEPIPSDFVKGLSTRMSSQDVSIRPSRGRLFLCNCTVKSVSVGRRMLEILTAVSTGSTNVVPDVFRAATIQGNVILEPRSLFVSATLSLTSCSFLSTPPAGEVHGVFVAEHAAAVGNLATTLIDVPGFIPLYVISKPGRMRLPQANVVDLRN
jgi:photosystem II stability/assembly factor-like uncharacterized protein